MESYRHLGYNEGLQDAADDARVLTKTRLREVARSLETNQQFSESYVAGYQTKVRKIK